MRGLFFPLLPLLALSCARKPASPEERGKAVYAAYDCRRCHRIGSEGGTLGSDLTYVGFRKSRDFLDLWLRDPRAWKTDTAMPDFDLNEASRRALAAYLATLRGQDSVRPWAARKDALERGREIYDAVGCRTCHGKAGAGGYPNNNVPGGVVPGLRRAAEGFTREELIARIASGWRPEKEDLSGPEPHLAMPAWKEVLSPEEIAAVADYVLSLKPKAAPGEEW